MGKDRLFILWENLAYADSMFLENPQPLNLQDSGVFSVGWSAPQIRKLKMGLNKLEYYTGTVDAVFTPDLQRAVETFQSSCSL